MSLLIRPEDEPQIQPRNPFARPGPIPYVRLAELYVEQAPSLVARAESSSSTEEATSSVTCGPKDNSGPCEKYYGADNGPTNTLAIVLGVIIPLVLALVVLIFLHRRHVKKLRKEDAEERQKALDYGLYEGQQGADKKRRRKGPEMSMPEDKEVGRRGRGLSLDLGMNNPYLLPPELQQSRASLHSLSRSMNTGDDKYRATTFIPDDGSIRPPSSLRSPVDDSSSYTGSSTRRFQLDSKQNLLRNAQENPVGPPVRHLSTDTIPNPQAASLAGGTTSLVQASSNNNNLLAPAAAEPIRDSYVSTASSNGAVNALRASNNYLAQFISGGSKVGSDKKEPPATVAEIKVDPPAEELQAPPPAILKDAPRAPLSITFPQHNPAPSITLDAPETRQPRLPQLSFIDSQGNKQSSVESGELVDANPATFDSTSESSNTASARVGHGGETTQSQLSHGNEQSPADGVDYYDESEVYDDGYDDYRDYQDYQDYVESDPRRLTMGMRPLPPDDPTENPEQRANRIRSFYKEYFDETKQQKPAQNAQYHDGADSYYDQYCSEGHRGQGGFYPGRRQPPASLYGRHRATVSNGSYMSGPRAFSSASGRYGGRPPRSKPKKELPLPKAENVLPTPHLLKDDAVFFLRQSIDTPGSPRRAFSPYSAAGRAHTPLASSFDDLAVLPSP